MRPQTPRSISRDEARRKAAAPNDEAQADELRSVAAAVLQQGTLADAGELERQAPHGLEGTGGATLAALDREIDDHSIATSEETH